MKKLIIPIIIFIIAFSSIHLSSQNNDSLNKEKIQLLEKKVEGLESYKDVYKETIGLILGYITIIIAIAAILFAYISSNKLKQVIKENKGNIIEFKRESRLFKSEYFTFKEFYIKDKKNIESAINIAFRDLCNFNFSQANIYLNKEEFLYFFSHILVSIDFQNYYIESINSENNFEYYKLWIKSRNDSIDLFIDIFNKQQNNLTNIFTKNSELKIVKNSLFLVQNVKSEFNNYKIDELEKIKIQLEDLTKLMNQ